MGEEDARRGSLADRLGATPAEIAGLTLLLLGALAVAGVLWWLGISDRDVAVLADRAPDAASGEGSVVQPAGADDDGGLDGAAGEEGRDGQPSGGPVVVHVGGAVADPGVVRLAGGARVADAVRAAGGALPGASPDALNLARPLVDGERVLVPTADEVAGGLIVPDGPGLGMEGDPQGGAAGSAGAVTADGGLDLNRATPADLEGLPGIGPVLAQRIADWRDSNGPFTAVTQLREVTGIGERRYEQLEDLVTVR